MGKVVLLGGNARSGKTTVSYELLKHGYRIINFDDLNTYLEDGLGIIFDELSKEKQFLFF